MAPQNQYGDKSTKKIKLLSHPQNKNQDKQNQTIIGNNGLEHDQAPKPLALNHTRETYLQNTIREEKFQDFTTFDAALVRSYVFSYE
jgi:hypothetical protein